MVYLYCPRKSDSARYLTDKVAELGGSIARIKKIIPKVTGKDVVVNWGASVGTQLQAARVLNGNVMHNKHQELHRLRASGVRVPAFDTRPHKDWLVRLLHHHEANDLLANLSRGDYYVQYIPLSHEFRIHIWAGKSFRAGIKQPRTDTPHPRFRSWNAGWKLDYGTICQNYITNEVRNQAKNAVAALGYDFGAVDVGLDKEGRAWVLEVNSAPGLEGHTIEAYARKLLTL